MPRDLTLVLLAAGLGRRFGGDKQFATVTDTGATLLDYTLHDARRAGFGRVVCVIRPGQEAIVEQTIAARWSTTFEIACAPQRLDALPAGFACPADRTRPWGTGHAVLAARPFVETPFVVVNADDFYGETAIGALAGCLRDTGDSVPPTYTTVSYRLGDTLSDIGRVNRAKCVTDADGWLDTIREITGIERDGDGARACDASGNFERLAGDTAVSMNIWGFTPTIFDQLEEEFRTFLDAGDATTTGEFYLPQGVQNLIRAGRARVRVLSGSGRWCGLTHPEDASRVRAFIAELTARGTYPARLWP